MRYFLIALGLVAGMSVWVYLDPPQSGAQRCEAEAGNRLRATREDWRDMARVVCAQER